MRRHRLRSQPPTSLVAIALLASALALPAAGAFPAPVRASTEIVVTTTEDELNADGDCSLREAIVALNTGATTDGCPGGDVRRIVLEPGATYHLTIAGADEDAGLTGDLDILKSVHIEARSEYDTTRATIDGGGLDRIFDVHESAFPFRVLLTRLNLTNGDAAGGDGGAVRFSDRDCDPNDAGGLRGVELSGVVIDGNRAARGGGVHIGSCNHVELVYSSIVRNAAELGGGLSVDGASVVSLETVTVSSNEATVAGGGIWSNATAELFGWDAAYSTIAENRAPEGGGLWSSRYAAAFTSIVAANDGGNCGGPDGVHVSNAVADDDTCGGPGFEDMGLMPLVAVEGAPVHLLAPHSPAIDAAGEPVGEWCGSYGPYDQVGTLRPLDGDGDGVPECDAGAIEAPAVPVTLPAPSPAPSRPPLPDTAIPPRPRPSMPSALLALSLTAVAVHLARGWPLQHRRSRPR